MYAILNIVAGTYLYIGLHVHEGFLFSEEEVRKQCINDCELALFSSKEEAELMFNKSHWRIKDCLGGDSFVVINDEEIALSNPKNRILFEIVEL